MYLWARALKMSDACCVGADNDSCHFLRVASWTDSRSYPSALTLCCQGGYFTDKVTDASEGPSNAAMPQVPHSPGFESCRGCSA